MKSGAMYYMPSAPSISTGIALQFSNKDLGWVHLDLQQ